MSRLGGRLSGRIVTEGGTRLEPFVETNWWHSTKKTTVAMDENVVSSNLPRDIAELKVGLKTALSDTLSLTFDVSAQRAANNYEQYGAQIGLRYTW